MTENNKRRVRLSKKFVAVCAAAVLAVGMGTTAYAADIGGIQRTIQIWLHGDQTDAVLEINRTEESPITEYKMTYSDENGEQHEMQGGGVAFDENGNEMPLSESDIMAHLNSPEVLHNDDGTIIVYYKDQKLDITDKFDEDGICYTQIKDGDTTYYFTISKDDGYAMSTTSYPPAKELLDNKDANE